MNEPANPFGPGFSIQPLPKEAPWERRANQATLWQFGLALLVLYLIMRYVPKGEIIGVTIFAAALISSPEAVKGFTDMLDFLQSGRLP